MFVHISHKTHRFAKICPLKLNQKSQLSQYVPKVQYIECRYQERTQNIGNSDIYINALCDGQIIMHTVIIIKSWLKDTRVHLQSLLQSHWQLAWIIEWCQTVVTGVLEVSSKRKQQFIEYSSLFLKSLYCMYIYHIHNVQ